MKLKKNSSGFTLIEILVAMVVLAIGLLGMAAMTMMVVRGSRGASDLTAATNICQLKLEELKDIQWTNLGNGTSGGGTDLTYGITGAGIMQETSLNSRGKTCAAESDCTPKALGPYKYVRSFVVCKGEETAYPPANSNPAGTSSDCGFNPADTGSRSQWLKCLDEDITGTKGAGNPEKKIKVLCTWSSRDGQCHSVHLETTAVQLGTN